MRYLDAVRAQGCNIRACHAGAAARLFGADLTPWHGKMLALAGMGASYNAILAVVNSFWAAGLPVLPWLASDLQLGDTARLFGAVVAVTQSGRSTEVVSGLAALPGTCPKLVLTDDLQSPAAAQADLTVPLSLLEDSAVHTLGYTGTVAALCLLRNSLADSRETDDWERAATETGRLVPEAERFAERVLPSLRAARSFDVVGSGSHLGSAAQAALLLREVARLPASTYETRQYLHGPLEAAEPGLAVIVIGGSREVQLAISLASAGAVVVLITCEDVDERDGLFVFRLPRAGDSLIAVLEILPPQLIALVLAEALGVPVDEFRHHQDDTKVA